MTLPSIIFATNNQHKADEIRQVLKGLFEIKTLKDAGIAIEIPEPYHSLEENAREKSSVIHSLTGANCFSEDTGLEVAALNGEPSVKSARYAGEDGDAVKNRLKLLQAMSGIRERKAQFRTVISLILKGKEYQFEGICKGSITEHESGENGFGYDSLFVPDGSEKTFAQMTMVEKTEFSHRRKATDKFISFLNSYNGQD